MNWFDFIFYLRLLLNQLLVLATTNMRLLEELVVFSFILWILVGWALAVINAPTVPSANGTSQLLLSYWSFPKFVSLPYRNMSPVNPMNFMDPRDLNVWTERILLKWNSSTPQLIFPKPHNKWLPFYRNFLSHLSWYVYHNENRAAPSYRSRVHVSSRHSHQITAHTTDDGRLL